MKLKDLTPKGQKSINEFYGISDKAAKRDNRRLMNKAKDFSTMELESNIDQKWKDLSDMSSDMEQWVEASYNANGEDAVEDIAKALEGVAKWSRSIVDKKDDPSFTDDEKEFWRR